MAVCILTIGGAAGYVLKSRADHDAAVANAPKVEKSALENVDSRPRIVFRNTALGDDYGKVAMVPLSDPGGPRAITDVSCTRIYAVVDRVLCLSSHQGVVLTYKATVLDSKFHPKQTLPIAGVPSRARLSLDGSLAVTTSFVSGDSYGATNFSTRTIISGLNGSAQNFDLETFALIHDGQEIEPADRNYWGVTFRDDKVFYATVRFGGHTWLVRGNLENQTLTTMHEDAECPSLSPDGNTIVYKKRGDLPPGQWRLASYNLANGSETLLAEKRNVDDQVDWLDNTHVVYGIPRSGSQAAIDDIFSVPADGSGSPKLLVEGAWSPAVIH